MLTIVSLLRHTEVGPCPNPETVAIAGWHKTGPVVAAAGALAGEAIDRVAVDTQGFRFGKLLDYRDPMFLPGGAKYLDLGGLIALNAPRPLWLRPAKAKNLRSSRQRIAPLPRPMDSLPARARPRNRKPRPASGC